MQIAVNLDTNQLAMLDLWISAQPVDFGRSEAVRALMMGVRIGDQPLGELRNG